MSPPAFSRRNEPGTLRQIPRIAPLDAARTAQRAVSTIMFGAHTAADVVVWIAHKVCGRYRNVRFVFERALILMSIPAFLSPQSDGVLLSIKLQPRASANAIGEAIGNELKVK